MAFLPGNFRCNRAHTLAGHIFKENPPPSTATICQRVSYKAAFGKRLSAKWEGVFTLRQLNGLAQIHNDKPRCVLPAARSVVEFRSLASHFTCHVSGEKEQG